jgi:hypothetical protein
MTTLVILVLIIIGVAFGVYGAHGIFVYVSKIEALSKDPQQLFLAIEMPEAFRGAVEWMTARGLESWIVPIVFIIIGIGFCFLATRISSTKKQNSS